MGWLKQQTFIFSQLWKLRVQGQGAAGLVSPEAPLLGLKMPSSPCVLTVLPSVLLHTWCLFLFLRGHQSYGIGAHPYDLI